MILAWECSWFSVALLTYGEAMKPTFGDGDSDIKMPADGDCFYHCFNYAKSNGTAPLTREHAMRLRSRVVARIRREGLSAQADRLLELGYAGYPDEEDFRYFGAEAGFSFVVVPNYNGAPLVYGSELGPVCLTVRRCSVRTAPHYDVISYETPTIKISSQCYPCRPRYWKYRADRDA